VRYARSILALILLKRERAQEEARKLREALESAFATVPGDRRFCVRRSDVVEHVARTLGIRVLNNRVFRQVCDGASAL
jgi:hypothetical protein